jgi:hypothetical protein
MSKFNLLALFCEDVRTEVSGQETVVGTLGDNIEVGQIPGLMPKLGIYLKYNFAIDFRLHSLSSRLLSPDQSVIAEFPVELEILAQANDEAKSSAAPYFGLKQNIIFAPFPITVPGFHAMMCAINGRDHLAGFINIKASPITAQPEAPPLLE